MSRGIIMTSRLEGAMDVGGVLGTERERTDALKAEVAADRIKGL